MPRLEITLDDAPIAPPEGVNQLLTSIYLDLGEIPPEYLVPAGPGEYDPSLLEEKTQDPDTVWQGTYHEEGASLYPEWDFGRQHYRKNWCVMREKEVTPLNDGFAQQTLDKHSGLVKHLRRTFEAMRDENRLLKREPSGDEVDIDALIEALADARDGSEMSDRLFMRMHRSERNIAVMFMVDMSGINQGLDQRRGTRIPDSAVRNAGTAGRPLRHLRLFRHHPQTLRNIPRQKFRRTLWGNGAAAHRRHLPAGVHAHGRRHPSPLRHTQ